MVLNDLRAKDAAAKEFASKVFLDEELEGGRVRGMKCRVGDSTGWTTSPARTEKDVPLW